jgi:hypothetical protein
LGAEPARLDIAAGRALLAMVMAGGIVIATGAICIALAVNRPVAVLLQPIGLWGVIGLVAASLLCLAAGRRRGPVSHEGLERLLGAWAVFRLAFFVAVMILLAAWLTAFAADLEAQELFVQAFLLTLISSFIASLAVSIGFNLRRAIHGPRRR